MGFGFNLFFTFILLPVLGILLVIFLLYKKTIIINIIGFIGIGILSLIIFSISIQWLTSKTELEKEDYYGQYIVNRNYFSGKQADWQYSNFRFEIKENDSIYFHVTNQEKILKTYRGKITTVKPYNSERLKIIMDLPTHHIIVSNPIIYRSAWSFNLVFHSPIFNNVYFKKGNWKTLEK